MSQPVTPRYRSFFAALLILTSLSSVIALFFSTRHSRIFEYAGQTCKTSQIYHSYSGNTKFDDTICILLAFFNHGYKLEQAKTAIFDFGCSLTALVAILHLEGARPGLNKTWMRWIAIVIGIPYQLSGVCVWLPVWFAGHILTKSHTTTVTSIQKGATLARAIIPALSIGFLIPSIATYAPVSERLHQHFLALWQPFPVYVALAQEVIASMSHYRNKESTLQDYNRAFRNTLRFTGYVSFFGHMRTLYKVWEFSKTQSLDLATAAQKVYFPPIFSGVKTFGEAVHAYLSIDEYFVFAAAAIFVIAAPHNEKRPSVWKMMGLLVEMVVITVLAGPGAAVSYVWLQREEKAPNRKMKKR